MGDVYKFPRDREAALRIDFCDPGPDTELDAPARGRVPPHNLDAEAAVLAGILSAPDLDVLSLRHGSDETLVAGFQRARDAIQRALDMLRPEHFYSEAHGRIYQGCQQLKIQHTPVDAVSVGRWIEEHGMTAKVGGDGYLKRLAYATPTAGHADAHAKIVLECWERRQLIKTCQRVMVEPYGDVGPWDAYKAKARAELGRLTAPRPTLAGAPIGVASDEAHANVNAAQSGAVPGVPWCFDTLDHFGLLGQGKQHVLAARPGMGKTALAFQVAARIADLPIGDGFGEAVYWCSWEMSRSDLLEREACSLAEVSYKSMQRRMVGPMGQERVAGQLGRLRSLPIWIDDERCSPAELAARVRVVKLMFEAGAARMAPRRGEPSGRLYEKCRMRVVVVDQLSEVHAPADVNPRADQRIIVGATAKAIQREIAKALNVATLLLCQIGRPKPGMKVERPTLSELRESGQIEEGADEVHAIHRRQYYERNCAVEWRNVAEVIPLKGRYGHEDEALMGFYAGRFSDALPAAARGEPDYG